jgi:hypothetical protein
MSKHLISLKLYSNLKKDLAIVKKHLKGEDDFLIYFIKNIKPKALEDLIGVRANLISNYQEGLEKLIDSFLGIEEIYYLDKAYLDISYLKIEDRLIDLDSLWELFTQAIWSYNLTY